MFMNGIKVFSKYRFGRTTLRRCSRVGHVILLAVQVILFAALRSFCSLLYYSFIIKTVVSNVETVVIPCKILLTHEPIRLYIGVEVFKIKCNQWRILRVFKVFSEHPDNLTKNFFLNLLFFFFFKL